MHGYFSSMAIYNDMLPVIDFRNGRYQGQTRNQLPHGVGLFIDKSFLLCLGEWLAGELQGNAIIIFPSGRVFAGGIAYRQQQGTCLYELPEDHVQLLVAARQKGEREKMAAVLPLLKIILQIDNTRTEEAKILAEYTYSPNEEENRAAVAKILGLDRASIKEIASYSSFIQFFRDKFLDTYPEALEFLVNQHRGRKEYFLGLRGEGLGVKIQPSEELSLAKKQSGRVYAIRALGMFTKDNQLREIGLKMLDNPMKGVIIEEGIFSLPHTLVKYEPGKRPLNCSVNFHNHIKRSLFYRDKVLDTEYIYELERYVLGFNKNLRVVQTERLAQFTIENPNNSGQNLAQIERKRRQRERQRQTEGYPKAKQTPRATNPYNPTEPSLPATEFNLHQIKDDIYRSASKKKALPNKLKTDYKRVEYMDPSYQKLGKEDWERLPNFQRVERPIIDPYARRNGTVSPYNRPKSKSKSPYQYLYEGENLDTSIVTPVYRQPVYTPTIPYESRRPKVPYQPLRSSFISNKYRSEREPPLNDRRKGENIRSPLKAAYTPRYPQSQQPAYKSFLQDQTNISRYRIDNPKPKYNYHFDDEPGPNFHPVPRPTSSFRL